MCYRADTVAHLRPVEPDDCHGAALLVGDLTKVHRPSRWSQCADSTGVRSRPPDFSLRGTGHNRSNMMHGTQDEVCHSTRKRNGPLCSSPQKKDFVPETEMRIRKSGLERLPYQDCVLPPIFRRIKRLIRMKDKFLSVIGVLGKAGNPDLHGKTAGRNQILHPQNARTPTSATRRSAQFQSVLFACAGKDYCKFFSAVARDNVVGSAGGFK